MVAEISEIIMILRRVCFIHIRLYILISHCQYLQLTTCIRMYILCMCTLTLMNTYTCIHVCMCVCMYERIMYACMYVCMYVYMYVCMYVCM